MRHVLLVPSLHPGNIVLWRILSLFCRIEARIVHPTCIRFLNERLGMLDVGEYLDADEFHCFRSGVLKLWERLFPGVPAEDWHVTVGDRELDCSGKAKQELADEFEGFLLLTEIQHRQKDKRKAFVIDSARVRYLRSLRGASLASVPRCMAGLCHLNSTCDIFFLHSANLTRSIRLGLTFIQGILQQWMRRRGAISKGVSCIYHAMIPSEMSLSRDDRSGFWIVDGERIRPKDVIFVMPIGADPKIESALRKSKYRVLSVEELVSGMPARILMRTFGMLLGFVCTYPLRAMGNLSRVSRASYMLSILTWKPIADHLKPKSYVISFGDQCTEDAAIVYLNAVGVRTVMYCHAANSYLIAARRCGCDFRSIYFTHILVSMMAVWHENFKQYVEAHPQEGVDVRVIGPLMSGDESVFTREVGELRKAYCIKPQDGTQGLRVVSVFDVASFARGSLPLNRGHYHLNNLYTEKYIMAFLRDMVRLVSEREDILLLFKPQRDMTKTKFLPSEDYASVVRMLQHHRRVVVVKDTINPWVPIAVAELSIAVPFTSPALAAMHYGRPAIYHDALNRCIYHRYESLEKDVITHSYEALRSKVDELLAASEVGGGKGITIPQEILPYIGRKPGTNSTEVFQDIIVPRSKLQGPAQSVWQEDEGENKAHAALGARE